MHFPTRNYVFLPILAYSKTAFSLQTPTRKLKPFCENKNTNIWYLVVSYYVIWMCWLCTCRISKIPLDCTKLFLWVKWSNNPKKKKNQSILTTQIQYRLKKEDEIWENSYLQMPPLHFSMLHNYPKWGAKFSYWLPCTPVFYLGWYFDWDFSLIYIIVKSNGQKCFLFFESNKFTRKNWLLWQSIVNKKQR